MKCGLLAVILPVLLTCTLRKAAKPSHKEASVLRKDLGILRTIFIKLMRVVLV